MAEIAIDPEGTLVDERIAPLVALTRHHGLTPIEYTAGDETIPAAFLFPDVPQAVEFVLQTQHYLGYGLGDQIAMTVLHPPEESETPRGKVSWLPCYTHNIVNAWVDSYR